MESFPPLRALHSGGFQAYILNSHITSSVILIPLKYEREMVIRRKNANVYFIQHYLCTLCETCPLFTLHSHATAAELLLVPTYTQRHIKGWSKLLPISVESRAEN